MVQQILTFRDMGKYCDELFTGVEEAKKAAPVRGTWNIEVMSMLGDTTWFSEEFGK